MCVIDDSPVSSVVLLLPLIPAPFGLGENWDQDSWIRPCWIVRAHHQERFVVAMMAHRRAGVLSLIAEELMRLTSDPRYQVGRCEREGMPFEQGPLRVLFRECTSRVVVIDVIVESNMDALIIRESRHVVTATRRGVRSGDSPPARPGDIWWQAFRVFWLPLFVAALIGVTGVWFVPWVVIGYVMLGVGLSDPDLIVTASATVIVVLVAAFTLKRLYLLSCEAPLKGDRDFPSNLASFGDRVRQAIYVALDRAGVHQGMVTHTPSDASPR